jgi:hypothetical protein
MHLTGMLSAEEDPAEERLPVRVALALEGHAHVPILPRQPRRLDARDPGRPRHFGAHHAPIVRRGAEDLPGRGRIGVRVEEGNVPVGEETGLERRGIARGISRAAGGLLRVIEHGSVLPTGGGLVD